LSIRQVVSISKTDKHSGKQKEKAMIDAFNSAADSYVEENTDDRPAQQSEQTKINKLPENMIGVMTIPKIDLTVPLVDGIDSESLKYAVGRFKDTAMPGEKGNCAVAGHRSFTYNQYFNRLDEVIPGDVVTVKTQKGVFNYTVYEKKIIDPTDLSVLDKTDDPIITLITCHPARSSQYRLIVRGRLN
jgi:sortase A